MFFQKKKLKNILKMQQEINLIKSNLVYHCNEEYFGSDMILIHKEHFENNIQHCYYFFISDINTLLRYELRGLQRVLKIKDREFVLNKLLQIHPLFDYAFEGKMYNVFKELYENIDSLSNIFNKSLTDAFIRLLHQKLHCLDDLDSDVAYYSTMYDHLKGFKEASEEDNAEEMETMNNGLKQLKILTQKTVILTGGPFFNS
jgi:hypothetical protein